MNALDFAISYMALRVRCLELELELCRYRNNNPAQWEARIIEAKNLLDVLKGFRK